MNKTKKAVLIAVACVSVVMGAWGVAACNITPDTPPVTQHGEHNYQWVDNGDGTHSQKCQNTTGTCDVPVVSGSTEAHDTDGEDGACSKCGYKAEEPDPDEPDPDEPDPDEPDPDEPDPDEPDPDEPDPDEPVRALSIAVGEEKTIASLDTTGATLTLEDLDWDKSYVLSCENDKVLFGVGIQQGNPVTFEYSMMLRSATVYSTDGTLTNVVISLVEVEAEGYTEIELDEEVTVTGAGYYTPVTYQIDLEEGQYQILVDDEAIEIDLSSDVQFGDGISDGFVDVIYSNSEKAVTVSADGTYYVQAFADVTFKVIAFVHVHTEDTSRWESDSTGHWHPLTCEHGLYGEKGTVTEHTYGEASEPDENGIVTNTCTECGYGLTDISGLEAREVTGGAVSEGVYKTTITADSDWGGSYPSENNFRITCGDTAKTYTLEILSSNTRITENKSYDSIEEVGDTLVVVLRANETLSFGVTTNDRTCEEGYSYDVAFRIIESEAPDEGDIKLPATAQVGDNTKTVEANQKVYYQITSQTFSGDVKFTFGDGVTVMYLGNNISNEGEEIATGYVISNSSFLWANAYICVSSESGDISFNLENYVAPGKKGNPIDATFGADNSNDVELSFSGNNEQWFKLLSAEGGKFVIRADSEGANFAIYDSLTSWSSIAEGAVVIINLEANVPLYVCANHSYTVPFTFTVTEATEDDKGYSPDDPREITGTGEYGLADASTTYFTFTAEEDCTIVFTYRDGEENSSDRLVFYAPQVVNWEGGKSSVNSRSANTATIELKAGTYTFWMMKSGATTEDTFNVTVTPRPAETPEE